MVNFAARQQVQHYANQRIEFQPEHLLCEECWGLASTAYSEALVSGGTAQVHLQHQQMREGVAYPIGDQHGMHATITKREN